MTDKQLKDALKQPLEIGDKVHAIWTTGGLEVNATGILVGSKVNPSGSVSLILRKLERTKEGKVVEGKLISSMVRRSIKAADQNPWT